MPRSMLTKKQDSYEYYFYRSCYNSKHELLKPTRDRKQANEPQHQRLLIRNKSPHIYIYYAPQIFFTTGVKWSEDSDAPNAENSPIIRLHKDIKRERKTARQNTRHLKRTQTVLGVKMCLFVCCSVFSSFLFIFLWLVVIFVSLGLTSYGE